jgi:hypothetical protein
MVSRASKCSWKQGMEMVWSMRAFRSIVSDDDHINIQGESHGQPR